MTYIITFASSKGGSGKSTFCVNLAAYFGMRGRNVTILDTDFQKSSHDWVRESSDDCLENVKTYVANEENSIRQYIKQSRYDILCVDSQGAVSRELAACLEASDLIITPCRPSRDDLVGLGWVAAFARRVNPKFATSSDRLLPVLNAVNKHSVAFQHARQQKPRPKQRSSNPKSAMHNQKPAHAPKRPKNHKQTHQRRRASRFHRWQKPMKPFLNIQNYLFSNAITRNSACP